MRINQKCANLLSKKLPPVSSSIVIARDPFEAEANKREREIKDNPRKKKHHQKVEIRSLHNWNTIKKSTTTHEKKRVKRKFNVIKLFIKSLYLSLFMCVSRDMSKVGYYVKKKAFFFSACITTAIRVRTDDPSWEFLKLFADTTSDYLLLSHGYERISSIPSRAIDGVLPHLHVTFWCDDKSRDMPARLRNVHQQHTSKPFLRRSSVICTVNWA